MYCVFVHNDYNLYMENGSSIAFVLVYPNNYIIIVVIYSQIVIFFLIFKVVSKMSEQKITRL